MPSFTVSTSPEPEVRRRREQGITTIEAQNAASNMYSGNHRAGYGPPNDMVRIKECVECTRQPHSKHYDSPTRNPILYCEACTNFTRHNHHEDRGREVGVKAEIDHMYECKCGARRAWGVSLV